MQRDLRGGDIGTGDPLDGCVEVVERVRLHDLSADFGTDAECWETALDSHEPVRRCIDEKEAEWF